MYTVEHNIPVPEVRHLDAIRTFNGMNHGDSFLVPFSEAKLITNIIRNRIKRQDPTYRVITRRYSDNVRIWKVSRYQMR